MTPDLLCVVFLCIVFVLLGCMWLDQPGLYEDEVLFAAAIYDPVLVAHDVKLAGRTIPTMIMTYVGTLKSYLFALLFLILEPSPATIRFPMLIVGATTLYLIALIFRMVSHRATMISVTALLATDVNGVLTTRLDWGPVALQHMLVALGVYAIARFAHSRSTYSLALGFFVLGLALWNKALVVWMFAGLGCATAAAYWPFAKDLIRTRWHIVTLSFCAGALPFLIYNLGASPKGGTLRGQSISFSDVSQKAIDIWRPLRGDSLHGWAARDDFSDASSNVARTRLEQLSLALSDLNNRSHRTYLDVALVSSLLLLPLIVGKRDRRLVWFLLVALGVSLAAMLLTRDAGRALHHVVLLWPLPHALIAVAAGSLWQWKSRALKTLVTVFLAALMLSNAVVINEFYALLLRNGATPRWTDATYQVADYFGSHPAKSIVLLDWGLMGPLRILSRGTLPLHFETGIMHDPGIPMKQWETYAETLLLDPGTVFVTNVEPAIPGAEERLSRFAASRKLTRVSKRVFTDRKGIAVIEAFAYSPIAATNSVRSP